METRRVLIVGATGYIGGRLVPRLLKSGHQVRVVARSLRKASCRPWARHPNVELVQGDAMDFPSMLAAARGCHSAYYLVHSMLSARRDFAHVDRQSAENMVRAAAEAQMGQIIYLGGLGSEEDPDLSEHLHSRHEVGRILQKGPVPATVLRAAMILGSGSASFEMLRYLVDRLPIMITPRWVRTPVQPISVTNVLEYLEGCLDQEAVKGKSFDIGGPEILTYEDLIHMYAELAGLPRRTIIPVPVLTPGLSALWIHLVTPIPSSIAHPLAEGLRNEVVCKDDSIRHVLPIPLQSCREAMALALERLRQQTVESCWTDAGNLLPPEWTHCGDAPYAGGTLLQCGHRIVFEGSPAEIWENIVRIGGSTGWYFGNPLWKIRGGIDRLAGGVGLSRGRRHSRVIHTGDALDFWRVLEVEEPHRLLLLAEMKMPGEAVLEFRLTSLGEGRTELTQVARFLPRGLLGILYWYALYPFHAWIFEGMLRNIGKKSDKEIVRGPEKYNPDLQNACQIDISG